MPITPYHWGPLSVLGLLLFNIFDFPTLLISGIILDIEPFIIIGFGLNRPFHGTFHNFLFGFVIAIFTAIILYKWQAPIKKIMAIFKLEQDSSFGKILWTSIFGVYSHILLDSPLYTDIRPFYPLKENPFYHAFSLHHVYLFCSVLFPIAIVLYVVRVKIWNRETN